VKLTDDILAVLTERAEIDGNRLVLTGPRMNPKLYQLANEVLEAVGGRWTTSVQAHVFPIDAAEAIAPVLATGEVVTLREKRTQAQYFPTPAPIVARLLELADLKPGMEVLEPSAGSGAIATAAASRGAVVDCFERDPGYAAVLAETGAVHSVRVADFLTVAPDARYDRVVMNPPFTKGADMEHVTHALQFLKPDGLLAAVMSWTVVDHNRRTANFRSLVEARGGTVEAVAAGAFKESGTDVPTVIVTIPATRPADAKPTVWPTREVATAPEPEFRNPLDILNEIRSALRTAMKEFDAIEALLKKPTPVAKPRQADIVELPALQEQLAFDGLGEAS
jgi:predicted RNA methylase